jgi:hypothetical protein
MVSGLIRCKAETGLKRVSSMNATSSFVRNVHAFLLFLKAHFLRSLTAERK